MQCPRCGYVNDAAAHLCANCSSLLPLFTPAEPQPEAWPGPLPLPGQVVDAASAALPRLTTDSAEEAPLPSWLAGPSDVELRGRMPPQGAGQQLDPPIPQVSWPRSFSVPLAPPIGPFPGSLNSDYISPPFGAGAFSAPQLGNGNGLGQFPFASGPIGGRALVPFEPQGLASSSPPFASFARDVSTYDLAATSDPLAPGSLLKGGRYRLLQRFVVPSALQPQGNEPPLMVAADTELAGDRVLVQELRLSAVRPEDSDRVRRLIAQRLELLSRFQGVAKLIDQFGEQRRHFLVFELPSGETLLDRIQRARGGLDETVAIRVALQALDVLAALERQQPHVIHGNLSPAQVILRPSGQVVLVGVSPTLLMHPAGIVEHGQAGGVPGYCAPEQARGQATPRADLYAVCAILHHAVTGVAPTPRANWLHPPARRLNPNVSLELEEVIGNGLRPSLTQRYQSIAQLRQALEPLASGRRLTHVPEELRGDGPVTLVPMRDARGRLVLPRAKLSQNPLFIIMALLLVIVAAGGGLLYSLSPTRGGQASLATPTPNDIAGLYQSKGIGLSAGEFIFDQRPPGNTLKQSGARMLAAGDLRGALSAFQGAVAADQSDAEAAIYAADTQILLDKSPYVAVVAAMAFGDDDSQAAARSELQGVFLAQQHVNSLGLLPENLHVRVLILNSGQDPADATTASNVLLQRINAGNAQHLIGIIGWPESTQTRAAISALAPSGLAIISPTSTEDHMGGNGRFFQMAPSDSDQATELADLVANQLHPRQVMVASDPKDAVSVATAAAFSGRLEVNTSGQVIHHATYNPQQKASFDSMAGAAVAQGDRLIYLTGGDQPAVALAQAVRRVNQASGTDIHVLVGSRAYTSSLFGIGADPTAQLARSDPAALATLYLTSLAAGSARAKLGLAQPTGSAFAEEYAAQFGQFAQSQGLDSPDPTAILSYDAARVLLAADKNATSVNGGVLRLGTPTEVRDRLRLFDSSHPFMGAGGAISFTITGTQPVKALAILALSPAQNALASAPIAHTSVFAVVGGQSLYCGNSNCIPQ